MPDMRVVEHASKSYENAKKRKRLEATELPVRSSFITADHKCVQQRIQ
jgi:hypothetical protein